MSKHVKIVSRPDDSTPGSWVDAGDGVVLAAFVQMGVPACCVYVKDKSNLFLVHRDGKTELQFTNKAGHTDWFTEDDLEKLLTKQEAKKPEKTKPEKVEEPK